LQLPIDELETPGQPSGVSLPNRWGRVLLGALVPSAISALKAHLVTINFPGANAGAAESKPVWGLIRAPKKEEVGHAESASAEDYPQTDR
jgi:hypothetical protein